MKLKNGFVLREVAGSTVVVPTDAALNMNGMITLNETGKILWTALTDGADTDALVAALLAKYEVDEATAREGVNAFVDGLRKHGFLEE
jgi:hypothetical protein